MPIFSDTDVYPQFFFFILLFFFFTSDATRDWCETAR